MKRFLIRQQITVFANKYEVLEADEGVERIVAFAQQKRLALKEKITFYTDTTKSDVLFELKARNVMDFGARYDVIDVNGNTIGVIGKAFRQSIITSTWHVFKPGSEEAPSLIIEESNIALAIIRRISELLPFGEVVNFFKYHFDFKREVGGEPVATYRKVTLFRDHYALDIIDESLLAEHDWRTLVAVGVMLDALQGR